MFTQSLIEITEQNSTNLYHMFRRHPCLKTDGKNLGSFLPLSYEPYDCGCDVGILKPKLVVPKIPESPSINHRCVHTEATECESTKLCHMFGRGPELKMHIENLGVPST